MHRVVVTGLGLANSLGPNAEVAWSRLAAGENGIRRISFWDPAAYQTKVAAEVSNVPREVGLESYPHTHCRRTVRLFTQVAAEALRDAGLPAFEPNSGNDSQPLDRRSIGLAIGASVNYLDMSLMPRVFELANPGEFTLDTKKVLEAHARLPQCAFFRRDGDSIAAVAARRFGIGGPALINDTACAASLYAIGDAYHMIRRGQVTAMLAGGAAALVSPLSILAFAIIGALSRSEDPETASRPFDRARDGFVMGEGAGAVLLESLDSARGRGAKIYSEVKGFGSSLNAHTLTDPSPNGVAEAEAMRLALESAAVPPEEIDYVAAHGTSTPKNDPTETLAIKSAFGEHAKRLAVSSNKGQIGHTISAAGVSSVGFTLKAMEHRSIPLTAHLKNSDPECDLDYVPNRSRPGTIRNALVNAFAFGGQNASLVLQAWGV